MKKLVIFILMFTSFPFYTSAEGTSDFNDLEETIEIEESIQEEGTVTEENKIANAAETDTPKTVEEWLEYASSQTSSSERLILFVESYEWFPNDIRLQQGIDASAKSLLTWATTQHNEGKYDVAIDRYNLILSFPMINESVHKETERKLYYAEKSEQVPSASQLFQQISSETSSSDRLSGYIEGFYLYPNDGRFEAGINSSAQTLLNWAIIQLNDGYYKVAIERFDRILSAPVLSPEIKVNTEMKRTEAEKGKRPADVIFTLATQQSSSSERLKLFIEGYSFYPNDQRFATGINTSARSLLNWATDQHQLDRFDIALERYDFILSAPKLENHLGKETSIKLKYAIENTRIPTGNQLVNIANSETSSSPRLERFIEGFILYPTDKRFEEGVNKNAESLLNWTAEQHANGRIDVAIDRYELILSAPKLDNLIKHSTEIKLNYAKNNEIIPSADELIRLAEGETSSSLRLQGYIDGYKLFPNDKRFENGILNHSQALYNWAVAQHYDGRYDVAIDRYEFILSSPILAPTIKSNSELKLKDAKVGKRPALIIFQLAQGQAASSDRLMLHIEGHSFYPNDTRFREGINTSARSLLNWATTQHQNNQYGTAETRYKLILSAPALDKNTKAEAELKLRFAEDKTRIPTAKQFVDLANKFSSSSAKLEFLIEGNMLYPNDSQIRTGIADSARSLLNWAATQHKNGDFNTAADRYKKIIEAPHIPEGLKNLSKHYLQLANNRQAIQSNKKVINPKVQNYTYAQMEKDIKALEAMYPYLIKTVTIGKSLDGRNLYAIKLGHGETEVLFNASAHAREHMTTNVIMNMLDEYAYAYIRGNNFDGFNVRQVLDQSSIWFLPMNNPDGVSLVQLGPDSLGSKIAQEAIKINGGSRNFTSWKANARGVDLNRNYPTLWRTVANNPGRPSESHYKGPTPLSEPESQAMYKFILSRNFKTLVDYHSSGQVLYARLPGHIENLVYRKTGYSIIDETMFTSGGDLPTWFTLELGMPGLTPEISPYVGPRPIPLANWDSIWRKNDSVGLIVADEAYRNRNNR